MGDSIPVLMHVEPVLQVRDVLATVTYWHETLGFPEKWTWGEPPIHGGVHWDGVFIQFSLNPELASKSEGNWIWIRVRNLESLYNFHQKKNVHIVRGLVNQPWGMSEYIVKELNGYYIHFSAPIVAKGSGSKDQSSSIRIIARLPTGEEYRRLSKAVGWGGGGSDESLQRILSAPLFGLVAEDAENKKVVGCVLLLGDRESFYYVKDLMVLPERQNQRIGTMLMNELSKWLEMNAAKNAFVGLYTGESLGPFYQEFGFTPAFGMTKRIKSRR